MIANQAARRILVVEDEVIVAMELMETLRQLDYQPVARVMSGEEAMVLADNLCPDLVLMDICLKGKLDGIDTAVELRRLHGTPVIFLTAYSEEATLARARLAEPYGYLLKPFTAQALKSAIEIAIYKSQTETVLRQQTDLLALIARISNRFIGMQATEFSGKIQDALADIGQLLRVDRVYVFQFDHQEQTMSNTQEWCASGISPQIENLAALPFSEVAWWSKELLDRKTIQLNHLDDLPEYAANEKQILHLQGIISILALPMIGQHQVTGFVGFDMVTKERCWTEKEVHVLEVAANTIAMALERQHVEQENTRLQALLNQSRTMESMGHMAGKIAHDFNNMLIPVMGYTEMILEDSSLQSSCHRYATEIHRAAGKARNTIRQLLSLSRHQTLQIRSVDLYQLIINFQNMLQQTLGKGISLHISPCVSPCLAKVDAGQIEQVILNLVINARDAMPSGGTLGIELGRGRPKDDRIVSSPNPITSEYIRLDISDSGQGMDPETLNHIFEPFYSTKGNRGTGLGLASVYGIIRQHSGIIEVESTPGKGTRFMIYFPAVEVRSE